MKNRIARAVYEARKDGSEISASIRLAKNGQFSSVSGKIKDLKVSREGFAYAVIQRSGDKPFQNVRLDNILCLNKNNKVYKR